MASSRSKLGSSDQPYTRSETAFNADLRAVLRSQGLGVLHVRETDTPGAYDLLCTRRAPDPFEFARHFWVELKVMDEPLRPSQILFQRDRPDEPMFVLRLREGYSVTLLNRNDTLQLLTVEDFRVCGWLDTFLFKL